MYVTNTFIYQHAATSIPIPIPIPIHSLTQHSLFTTKNQNFGAFGIAELLCCQAQLYYSATAAPNTKLYIQHIYAHTPQTTAAVAAAAVVVAIHV